jgi:hypothetical protein
MISKLAMLLQATVLPPVLESTATTTSSMDMPTTSTSGSNQESTTNRESFERAQNVQVFQIVQQPLTWQRVHSILKSFVATQNKHITRPIENARAGEVYIFFSNNPDDQSDWRVDNFQWRNQGANKLTPINNPVLIKSYWHVIDRQKQKCKII